VKAVRRLVDDFSMRTEIQCAYVHKDPTTSLPPEVTICLYRVAQESLSNVARHAAASQVEVELICEDDLVSLTIWDNGVGFDAGQPPKLSGHLGLLSMKERIRLVNGNFSVGSWPAQGTHIRVDIPLSHGARHA
jgi:signal transduction histidine kinase